MHSTSKCWQTSGIFGRFLFPRAPSSVTTMMPFALAVAITNGSALLRPRICPARRGNSARTSLVPAMTSSSSGTINCSSLSFMKAWRPSSYFSTSLRTSSGAQISPAATTPSISVHNPVKVVRRYLPDQHSMKALVSKQCDAIYSAPEVNPTSCSIFSMPFTGTSR